MSRTGPQTILENAIMDRYEAGQDRNSIAADLKCLRATVDRIISYMQIGATDLKFGSLHLAKCNADMVAAIARHHPDRIAS